MLSTRDHYYVRAASVGKGHGPPQVPDHYSRVTTIVPSDTLG